MPTCEGIDRPSVAFLWRSNCAANKINCAQQVIEKRSPFRLNAHQIAAADVYCGCLTSSEVNVSSSCFKARWCLRKEASLSPL